MADLVIHAHAGPEKMEMLKAGIDQAKKDVGIEKDFLPAWLKKERFSRNVRDLNLDRVRMVNLKKTNKTLNRDN